MKYRDSGMPEENMWKTFFNPAKILKKMEINEALNSYLDIGCGYGTFLFPAAEIVGNAVGFDIDENMIKHCEQLKLNLKKDNIRLIAGDISSGENGFLQTEYKNYFDYVSLFNILHCEEPVALLKLADDLLNNTGKIGAIHWQYKKTPRGPSMEIRPRPEQIIEWAKKVKLKLKKSVDLPPYHYGLIFTK